MAVLRRQVKEQEKEIRRLKEAGAFFAASRWKYAEGENDISCYKMEEDIIKGRISFYCRMLKVTWQRCCKYLEK